VARHLQLLTIDPNSVIQPKFQYMSPNPNTQELHTRSVYLNESVVRYHERWDNGCGICTIGGGWGEGVRGGEKGKRIGIRCDARVSYKETG